MKSKITLSFVLLLLLACQESQEKESTTVSDAIVIGKEIKGMHEDFSEKMNAYDSAFNELTKGINQQLNNRDKGFKKFVMDSSMTKVNLTIEGD